MKNTENQIKNMKEQTIGVEVEMNNITRRRAASLIADFFGTQAWNAAREYGLDTEFELGESEEDYANEQGSVYTDALLDFIEDLL